MKEIYYWIVFVVVIAAAALYFRYYYTPGINISLGFAPGIQKTAYVYQKVTLPVEVFNNGSSIKGFEVGVLINGNLSGVYNITLSGGKETLVQLSHTFGSPGTYNFTVVGDPAMLYNLADRSRASTSAVITILNTATPDPASLLPKNPSSIYAANMTALGYAVSSYISGNYSVPQLGLSQIPQANGLLYPLLTLASSYIANVSYAGANYNNSRAFSLWVSGYISPSIVAASAQAFNLTITNESIGSENVTSVQLSPNTTLCGWYDGGWVKTLSYQGNSTCTAILESGRSGALLNDSLKKDVPLFNYSVQIANFSYYTPAWGRSGELSLIGGRSFSYLVLWKNFSRNLVCFGIVNYVNGTSYCSADILQSAGTLGNLSLIKTTEYIGKYNATVFSLVNSSDIFEQVDENIGMLKAFNLSGIGLNFTSGIRNSCSFPGSLTCGNVTYGNGILSFRLGNTGNSTIRLNSVYCFWNGIGPSSALGYTLRKGSSINLTSTCYNNKTRISGVALNLNLHLILNYSINNSSNYVEGDAFII